MALLACDLERERILEHHRLSVSAATDSPGPYIGTQKAPSSGGAYCLAGQNRADLLPKESISGQATS